MAYLFKMPMLGQTMEEGTVLQWFKQEGDSIKKGEILLEIMSDKANIEVESSTEGVLRKILTPVNETVPINTPIAIIGSAEEPIEALLAGAGSAPAMAAPEPTVTASPAAASAAPVATATPTVSPSSTGGVFLSPRAHRLADEHGVSTAALAGRGTGPGGRVVEKDILAYLEEQKTAQAGKARVTPLAAKIADEMGVNLEELALGLPGSRVRAEDVRRLAEETKAAPEPVPAGKDAAPASGEPATREVIPLRGLRKIIADNVTKSRQTAPHVTLTLEVDMTETVALFSRLQAAVQQAYQTKLTYTDLLIKASAYALTEHPLCNAALVGDEIRLYADKNIGIAVATDTGLLVPVIRQADTKPLGHISLELKALVERCRSGKQTPDDLSGGTFTITNLGVFGIDVFDPIIVPPQSCILGVCRIAEKPVVLQKEVVIRSMMNLCLSFDHRVLDGVPGARFLQRLKEILENPLTLFV
jgi:pyruvate dehydrogenase E2 component (dihydrolipoamide acetyltransferase)